MSETTNFHIDDFTLTTDSGASQFIVNILKGLIKGGIDTALSKTLPDAISGVVTTLN